jgi:hypothetical protein
MLCECILAYSLWHQIRANTKKKKCDTTSTTSTLSALALFIIGLCTLSVGLWLTFIAHVVVSVEWLTIFVQRLKYKRIKGLK